MTMCSLPAYHTHLPIIVGRPSSLGGRAVFDNVMVKNIPSLLWLQGFYSQVCEPGKIFSISFG